MLACIVYVLLAAMACTAVSSTDRPIIGVLTVPLSVGGCVTAETAEAQSSSSYTSCFHSLYVKWIESAGARVVPIRYNAPIMELQRLASSVNGILLTGGETPIIHTNSQYMHAAGILLNHTVASSDGFPLWATCMGIQTLSILVAGTAEVLESGVFTGVDPQMMALNFAPAAASSRMFGLNSTPSRVRMLFQNERVTTNLHHDGIDPGTYATNSRLAEFFNVLSVNADAAGRPFVSTIEAKQAPVYGVQWHPERPQFDWRHHPNSQYNSPAAIEAMSWLSRFYVGEARKNSRRFEIQREEDKHLIYNWTPQIGSSSYQPYLFK